MGRCLPHDYGAIPLWIWWGPTWYGVSLELFFTRMESVESESAPMDPSNKRDCCVCLAGVILSVHVRKRLRDLEYYSFGAWPSDSLLLGLAITRAEETTKPG